MAGNEIGGAKAAIANSRKTSILMDGRTVSIEPGTMYRVIGAVGGKNGHTGGFAARMWCDKPCPYDAIWGDHKINQCAGAKGGSKSRRGKSV